MNDELIYELREHIVELESNQKLILEWMKLHMKVGHP